MSPFDLVLSAQAFHWIDATYGCAKAARLLKPRGTIALVWHLDVSQNTDFRCATRPIYQRYIPSDSSEQRDPLAKQVDVYRAKLELSPVFDSVESSRHQWQRLYRNDDYLRLLSTFSQVGALGTEDRARFLDAIKTVVERFGGVVEQQYETVTLTASRM